MTGDSTIERQYVPHQQVSRAGSGDPSADLAWPTATIELLNLASARMRSLPPGLGVTDVVASAAGALSGVGGCAVVHDGGILPIDGSRYPLRDADGIVRSTLHVPGGTTPGVEESLTALADQAGLFLGCQALREASSREVARRQVSEFEADSLRSSFDQRLSAALGERGIWAAVFQGSHYSVCIISPDLRYVSFNPAFEAWFVRHSGIAPLPGQQVHDALSLRPDLIEEAESNWRRALSGESFTHAWHIGHQGTEHHYETRYAPLRAPDGEVTGAVQFSLDVSDRVAERRRLEVAETALRQSQKMEAVGKLTGGIAHDFNNILTGIVGALDIIGRRLSEGRTDVLPRYLDMASTSANRAASLTHRLLAFSRRHPVDPRLTDVEALLLGMGEMVSRTMGPDVTVETSTSGISARVLCDSSQLESAIMNLVVNAREAMPQGGRVLIASAEVALEDVPGRDEIRPGAYVRLAVSDTGTGMSAETLSQAVEPFFTTKPAGHGTGLGLSMVYGFARQSGGFLDIQSAPGEGTTVSIYLPATPAAPVADTACSVTVRSTHDATVLVVEDEPAVRMLVVEMLQEMGCRVIEAEDGGKGASILASDICIDLLVTDIGLPVLNGRQVATAARGSRPDLPILFMTGYAENAAITDGFGDHTTLVTKPFRPSQIADAVGRMLA